MTLKAYAVLETYENTGDIYFAEKAIVAARRGANEYSDGELGGIQCRRAPWADAYAATGVPARVAVEYGWRFECAGCGVTVDSDLAHEHRRPLSGICGTVHGNVYCAARCKARRLKTDARRRREQLHAIEDFKAIVLARFPDADFVDGADRFRSHHAHVSDFERSGHWHRNQVIVFFRFPGMTIGPASFQMNQRYEIGPAAALYYCCHGDTAAFEAYAEATRRV